MPLVSVIIPTYNRESFIAECVESVLAQTFSNFELIVVDDGSTDRTETVVGGYSDKIRYLRQEQRGPAAARNSGIRNASGEWLSFLDSDDLWLPNKLEFEMEYVSKNPNMRICYSEEIWYRRGRRVNPAQKHRKYSGWIYRKMLPLCIVSPSSVMIHRSVLEKVGLFDEELPACEDYDLWLRIGSRYPIALIPEALIIKRNGHEGQQSQKYWGMDRFRIKALANMLNSAELSEEDRIATQQVLQQKCQIMIQGCLKRDKIKEAEYYSGIMESHCGS
jgi:glycosyltransferase involved in cell wall biosynthesis